MKKQKAPITSISITKSPFSGKSQNKLRKKKKIFHKRLKVPVYACFRGITLSFDCILTAL